MRFHKKLIVSALAISLIVGGSLYASLAEAAQITSRSLQLSSNMAGDHNVTYNVGFSIATAGSIQSIAIEFCGNSALIEDSCVAPYGFDALNTHLINSTGISGFIVSPSSTVNKIVLTHAPSGPVSAGPVGFEFDNIVNPTDPESYYTKISTYTSTDATGSPVDFGALAFSINKTFDVSVEVPPYLLFCQGVSVDGYDCSTAQGDLLNLGQLSDQVPSVAQSQIVAATNASSGYNISMGGGTMTSGNNTLPPMSGTASAVGTSQFGINLRTNTNPDIGIDPEGPGSGTVTAGYSLANRFRFNNGDVIATAAGAQDYKKYTISYLVNVAKDQAPGVYSTTLTYICLANF